MKFLRSAFYAALFAAIYAPAAFAAVGGGAVASGVLGLIDFAKMIGAVIGLGVIMYWGVRLFGGIAALGVIAVGAIGLLAFLNPEDIMAALGQ